MGNKLRRPSVAIVCCEDKTKSYVISNPHNYHKTKSVTIQVFDHYLEKHLIDKDVTVPGPALHGCGYCVSPSGQELYVYGGHCGDKSEIYGGLQMLNLKSFEWKSLCGAESHNLSPIMKYGCGMACFDGKIAVIAGHRTINKPKPKTTKKTTF